MKIGSVDFSKVANRHTDGQTDKHCKRRALAYITSLAEVTLDGEPLIVMPPS